MVGKILVGSTAVIIIGSGIASVIIPGFFATLVGGIYVAGEVTKMGEDKVALAHEYDKLRVGLEEYGSEDGSDASQTIADIKDFVNTTLGIQESTKDSVKKWFISGEIPQPSLNGAVILNSGQDSVTVKITNLRVEEKAGKQRFDKILITTKEGVVVFQNITRDGNTITGFSGIIPITKEQRKNLQYRDPKHLPKGMIELQKRFTR